jgi:DNA-binding MarR family transcriptional regulator
MTRRPARPRAAVAAAPGPVPDQTDRVLHQWAEVRPDLDMSSVGVISRLARLRAIIDEEQEAVFAEHGISNPTFTTLVTLVRLNRPGGISQRRLADEMGLTPGTVSARIDRLVADGLVARAPDPADRRGSLVTLTDRGRDLFEAVVPAHLANQVRLLGSLTPDEQATLAGLLRKLLVAFEGSAELEHLPVRLGLTLAPVHVALAMQRAVGLPERPGLLVRAAEEQSLAAAAGLAEGDVLFEAAGVPLRSVSALYSAISEALPAGRLELRVRRGLRDRTVSVPLGGPGAGGVAGADGLAAARRQDLAVAHDGAAADDGGHRPALNLHPVERRPARAGGHVGMVEGAAGVQVDQRQVRVPALGHAAFAGDAEDALGQQGALGVGQQVGITGVGQAAVQGIE